MARRLLVSFRMHEVLRDIRHALRGLRSTPGFFVAAITILALGTGVNVAMMGLVDQILLRPLPYPESDRLVAIFEHLPDRGEMRNPTSPATFRDWRDGTRALEHVTAARPWSAVLRGTGPATEIPALKASPSLFAMLGVDPVIGRTVADGDEQVVVLGYDLWQRVFAGRADVVGHSVSLGGEPFTVVGVMPRGFAFPPFWATGAELWAPLVMDTETAASRGSRFLRVFARLRSDASIAQARSQLQVLSSTLSAEHPEILGGVQARLEPLIEPVVGDVRSALWILFLAVVCVLLLASSNVGNLVLVRALARNREMAVRRALGANRWRVVRLLLVESALVGTVGTAAGLLLSWWLIDAVATMGAASLPRLDSLAVDGRVLAYAVAVALVTVVAFGVAPALRLSRYDLAKSLRSGGRGMTGSRGRARSVVVVAELAAAMVLLVGAGLMLASLSKLGDTDLGVRVDRSLVVPISFDGTAHEAEDAQPALFETIAGTAGELPEIEAAALINHASLAGDLWRTPFIAEGEAAPMAIEERPKAAVRVVSDAYFEVAGLELLSGRVFDTRERQDSEPVVVVNRTLADRFFAAEGALGRRLLLGRGNPETDAVTIVGVVEDTRQRELRDATLPEIYHPYAQNPSTWFHATTLVLRTSGEAEHAAPSVVRALQAGLPELVVGAPRAMAEVVQGSLAEARFQTTSLTAFSALATVLAGLGVFGLMSFLARQRRDEIGLRMVVGAQRADIVALVFGDAARLVGLGLGLGLGVALALAQTLGHLVYGVSVYDLRTLIGAALALALVALAAAGIPALRASRQDPIETLRAS